MVTLSFDSALTTIYGSLELEVQQAICKELTYTDRSVSFQNKKQRWSRTPVDANRCLYAVREQRFMTGLLPRVVRILQNYNVSFELDNRIPAVESSQVEVPDWLYAHQLEMLDISLQKRRGIIKGPTGCGKTLATATIIKHFPNAQLLVTVPLKGLLHQTAKEYQKILGEPIGLIGDDIFEPQRVTIGIINSLANLVGKDKYRFQDVGVLLVDECHRAGSQYYVTVGNACRNADYRIGLSATPWRSNGDDLVLEGVLGPRILDIPETALIDAGVSVPPYYYCIPVPDPNYKYKGAREIANPAGETKRYIYPGMPDGKPDDKEVYEVALMSNTERNQMVVQAAQMFIESNYPFPGVILVERIEGHGCIIQDLLLEKGIDIPFIHGETKTKERERVLKCLGTEYRLILASTILKEGVDVPQLGFLVIAGGGGSTSGIIQKIGRSTRKYTGKDRAIIIDFEDQEKWHLNNAFQRRKSAVEKAYPSSYKQITIDCLPGILTTSFNANNIRASSLN